MHGGDSLSCERHSAFCPKLWGGEAIANPMTLNHSDPGGVDAKG